MPSTKRQTKDLELLEARLTWVIENGVGSSSHFTSIGILVTSHEGKSLALGRECMLLFNQKSISVFESSQSWGAASKPGDHQARTAEWPASLVASMGRILQRLHLRLAVFPCISAPRLTGSCCPIPSDTLHTVEKGEPSIGVCSRTQILRRRNPDTTAKR